METRINFLEYLGEDICTYIMSCLDDPADLVRASSVSRTWHHFVISNGFAKTLCMKTYPQLSNVVEVAVAGDNLMYSPFRETDVDTEQKTPERDHQVYASLLHAITKSQVPSEDCVSEPISASSTNRYNLKDISTERASYCYPDFPKNVIYRIKSNTWLITEVDILPFQAFFQQSHPIHSAISERLRVGQAKAPSPIDNDLRSLPWECPEDDKFEWSYTSPAFPIVQENRLQQLKLPKPVFCMNGYLQIELLGRVQRQEADGLLYIC